jgi:hypothetical protein
MQAYLAGSPQVIVALASMAAGLWLARSTRVRQFMLFAALCSGLQALYLIAVGGDFMHYRLMFHVYPLLVAGGLAGLAIVAARSAAIALVGSSALALASLAPTVLEDRYHMESLEGMYRCCGLPGIVYGRRLAQALPPDTVIATTMAGGVAYYSKLPTIDQLGLTDREVARHGVRSKEIRRGHSKRAPISYLRRRGVNLVLDHPTQCSCRQPCLNEGAANVFIRMEGDACLRTLYLTQTPALDRHFCSRPQDFVVTGLDCAGPLRRSEARAR